MQIRCLWMWITSKRYIARCFGQRKRCLGLGWRYTSCISKSQDSYFYISSLDVSTQMRYLWVQPTSKDMWRDVLTFGYLVNPQISWKGREPRWGYMLHYSCDIACYNWLNITYNITLYYHMLYSKFCLLYHTVISRTITCYITQMLYSVGYKFI